MTQNEPIFVLSTIAFSEERLGRLKQVSPRLQFNILTVTKSEEIPSDVWAQTEILYTMRILPAAVQAPHLRWVQIYRSSLEHISEMPLLSNPDVFFTTISGTSALPAAEFVLMCMLALGHRLPDMLSSQRKAEWDVKRLRQLKPVELRGSTVGIIGYGSVGREVARLLQPFQVKILATKFNVMHPDDPGYTVEGMGDPDGNLFHILYPYQAIRAMLKECDFVVICVPLTPLTHNLIGKDEMEAMKPGACLINISHLKVVNMEALTNALLDKRLGGTALDVFLDENPPAENPLWKMQNVVFAPRLAWMSERGFERELDLFEENLKRYIGGINLLNRYDPKRGY